MIVVQRSAENSSSVVGVRTPAGWAGTGTDGLDEDETSIPQAHLVEVQVCRGTISRTNSGEVKRGHLLKTIHVVGRWW